MKNLIIYLSVLCALSCLVSCTDENSKDSRFIYFGIHEPYVRIGEVEFIIDSYAGEIYNPEQLPVGTDLTAIKIWFATNHPNEGIFVNGTKQYSGETVNDFTNPVEYEIRTKNETRKYTVTINVSATCNTQVGIKLSNNDLVASVNDDESWWLSPSIRVSKVEFTTATTSVRNLRLYLLEVDNTDESIAIYPTLPDNGNEWGKQNMVNQAKSARDAGINVFAAINGDVFGDDGEPEGIVCRNGVYLKDTFDDETNGSFFGIRSDGRAALGDYSEFLIVKDKLHNAIGACRKLVIENGSVAPMNTPPSNRTAVGMNAFDLKTLYFVVVEGLEGDDPDDPKGITLAELAGCMITLGAGHAVSLDGGASSTFVVRGEDNQFTALNRPSSELENVGNGIAIISK